MCHAFEAGAPHGAGPNLYGVVDRAVGKIAGFGFSKALRESSATWSVAHLDAFIENPQGVYRRNRMAFSGIRDAATRAALISPTTTH